ncbi:MAG: hypothetical protein M0Z51_11475 [Propionibacterium sp.]|nr:hypothetical protein [Propionibacterium sp.]
MTRTIEAVEKPVVRTVEVPAPAEPHSAEEWAAVLDLPATRARGRIYRRDPPMTLQPAVDRLAEVWVRTVNQH